MINKYIFIKLSILISFLFVINANAQVNTYEIFPLSIHLKYSYNYNFTTASYYHQEYFVAEIDTGIVNYIICDSTVSNDTVTWKVKQIKNLYHRDYARDTSYFINDTSTISLLELTSGFHRLSCSSLVWNFSFADSTKGIFRYGTNSQEVIINTWGSTYTGGEDTSKLNDSLGLYYYESYSQAIVDNSYKTIAKLLNLSITSVNFNGSNLSKYSLQQNYPNPFNPTTTIEYSIPKTSFVNIEIYDLLGERISTLVNETEREGNHKVKFNGSLLSSGIYFYSMKAGNFVETKKLLLLK